MYGMGIGIFRTSTFGEDWEPMNNIQYDPNAQVGDFVKHGTYLMIPCDYLGAMRTSDDGETWEFCNNGITSTMDSVSIAATETAVFVGTSDSGLFMSKDYGDNWVTVNLGFPIDWQTQRFANPESMAVIGDYLYVGTWFYGLWRAKLSDLYAGMFSVSENSEAEHSMLCQNRPNPFRESTEIRYKLTTAGQVSLKVYDVYGRNISFLVDCRQIPGDYIVTFRPPPGCFLPAGIYYYQLETGEFSHTRTMMLSH